MQNLEQISTYLLKQTIENNSYKKLVKGCFITLSTELDQSFLDHSNEVSSNRYYAHLMMLTMHFIREGFETDQIGSYFENRSMFEPNQRKLYLEYFEKHKQLIGASLMNLSTFLPHVVDVHWKIDYVVKTDVLEEFRGPLFRIGIITEQYDQRLNGKKTDLIQFTCTEEEIQDLIIKLRLAVKHCRKMSSNRRK